MGSVIPLIPAESRTAWNVLGPSVSATRLRLFASAAVLVLYWASLSAHWYVSSDSALYLLLSESLAKGDGYSLWGRPHAHVPPGYPLMLAAMSRLGLGQMMWMNLGMILMGLISLWLGYKGVAEQSSERLALLVMFMVAFSTEMHRRSVQQLSDVPFMVCVGAGLWLYARVSKGERCCLELGSAALLASCWVRVVGIPLAVAAAMGLLLERGNAKRVRVWLNVLGLLLGVLATATVFAWQHRIAQATLPAASYAHYFTSLAHRSWLAWICNPANHFYETGAQLSRMFIGQKTPPALAIVIFWLPMLIGTWGFLRRRLCVGVLATAGYVGAVLLLRPMLSRYLLPVAPLLTLYFLEGVRWLVEWAPRLRSRAPKVVWACAGLMIAINLPKDLRLVYQLHCPDFQQVCDKSWPALMQAATFLAENAQLGDRFISSAEGRQLSYLSQVPFIELAISVLGSTPSEQEILGTLSSQSVNILIFDTGEPAPFYQALAEAVHETGAFKLVFDNQNYRIYSRRDP